jgi:beta-glucanase (GH16 family)
MKKLVYLCGLMLLSMNMMAQIDLNDMNWDSILIENFDKGLLHWQWDTTRFLNVGDYSWKSHMGGSIVSNSEHEVYQFGNCQINTADSTMHLVAYYDSLHCIQRNEYYLPKCMWPEYGGSGFPSSNGLCFFSGAIEYYKKHYVQNADERKFLYGYFEIRCKLPIHQGAFPAFWLHSADTTSSDPYYEEIDIFEYSWSNGDPDFHYHPVPNPDPTYAGDPWVITTGIYHNLNGHPIVFETDTYARNYPKLTKGHGYQDISDWHTYSCEWMPDHVYWFLDGRLVNSFCDATHIPRHPMTLKTNYAINGYYNYGDSIWVGTDEMVIDYIKVYQLATDCSTDETITCQNDLDSFDFRLKKSVAITASNGQITVDNTDKITFRVTDSFEITDPFQVDSGGEFTVIRQDCPTQ